MKKSAVILLSIILLASFAFPAAKKYVEDPKWTLFGDVGLAVSDFEGLFFDAGVQYGLSKNLFAEFLFEYYLDPAGSEADSSAYGLNLNGVYKLELSKGMNAFFKAGVCLIHTSVTFLGMSVGDSDIGFNAGGGVEYELSKTMGLRGGATMKISFAEGETSTFFKLYGGFFYRIK
jgi:opacity protein-like surface antigen